MKSLESRLFKHQPTYQNKLIKRIIAIIRYGGRSERCIQGYKMFIFKMMSELVKKNIMNYEKLMSSLPKCPSEMTRDEMITESYVILDICIKKFKPSPTNSFYFYFNKSLSRNFYRRYQRYSLHTHIEATEELIIMSPSMRTSEGFDTMSVLFKSLQFSEFEIRIVKSRLMQQSMAEFCRMNMDVNREMYKEAFESIKIKMTPHLSEFRNINLNVKEDE